MTPGDTSPDDGDTPRLCDCCKEPDDEVGQLCDGCGYCQQCCDCTLQYCDCDACKEKHGVY